jgi:hypothetical protein
MTSNFSATTFASDSEKAFTTYELDNGKVHSLRVEDTDSYESYYEFNSNGISNTTYYVDPDMNVWMSRKGYTGIGTISNSLGILPLPFSAVMFSVTAKAYTTSKWVDNYGSEYTNLLFKFENNILVKLNYTDPNGIYHETNFSKYGQISVTLPEIGSSVTPGKK